MEVFTSMTGSTVCATAVCFSQYRCTGKERDSESGNDYFKYRYYASSMGRWMSPDPSGLTHADLGNPQSFNLYSYVGNNPLTRADLDGLCWKGFQWACNIGQAIDNGVHNLGQAIDNSAHGLGFHTDKTVMNNVHEANQILHQQGYSTEGLSEREILMYAKQKPEAHEPDLGITAGTDLVGLAGLVVRMPLKVGVANAAASVINDRSNNTNTAVQLFGLWEPAAGPMAIASATADGFGYVANNSSGTVTDTWKSAPFLDPGGNNGAGLSLGGDSGAGGGGSSQQGCQFTGDC